MARKQEGGQGRLIVSVVHSSIDALADAVDALEKRFGAVQYETLEAECGSPDLYKEEMGDNLMRRFFSFERPIDRNMLPTVKSICAKIEAQYADKVHDYCFRTVNLDPGILTPANLVMAAYREMNHRIYLEDGVFGELTLVWSKGQFVRLPWTDLDYCTDESIDFFCRVRSCFELVEPLAAG